MGMPPRGALALLLFSWSCGSQAREAPANSERAAASRNSSLAEFVAGLPAGTRVVARAELGRTPLDDQFWDGMEEELRDPTAGASARSLATCGIDRKEAVRVLHAAIAEPFALTADLHGTITTAAIACLFGVEQGGGPLAVGDFTLSDREGGGVRITRGEWPRNGLIADEIRTRLLALADSPVALVARVGQWSAPVDIEAVQDERTTRVSIHLADAAAARSAAAWLAAAVGRAAPGEASLAEVKVAAQGRVLSLELPLDLERGNAAIKEKVAEAFRIPTIGMEPTLSVGDQVLVAKADLAGRAERGDLVAFWIPCEQGRQSIKRVVAIGGDTVEVRCDLLHVNGQPAAQELLEPACRYWGLEEIWRSWPCSRYAERLGAIRHEILALPTRPELDQRRRAAPPESYEQVAGRHDFPKGDVPSCSFLRGEPGPAKPALGRIEPSRPGTGPVGPCRSIRHFVVPANHVFVMGDNRDNSADSRAWGTVAADQIVGRVAWIWWSTDHEGAIRWDRIGSTPR